MHLDRLSGDDRPGYVVDDYRELYDEVGLDRARWYDDDTGAAAARFEPERPAWHATALCRGVAGWFDLEPDDAAEVCSACPSHDACLAHALNVPETSGVWGGVDFDAERARLADKRRKDAEYRARRRQAKERIS